MPDPVTFSPQAVFAVRTINFWQTAPHYPMRIHGLASVVHADDPQSPGLIGIQEVKAELGRCYAVEPGLWARASDRSGQRCFAAELSTLFGESVDGHFRNKPIDDYGVGAVAGDEWWILARESWRIGTWGFGNNNMLKFGDYRHPLVELALEHKETGRRLRFYSAYFVPGRNNEHLRLPQAQALVEIVRSRATPGELPPIVVGDFNAERTYSGDGGAPPNVQLLEEHFWRPIDVHQRRTGGLSASGIDLVYIGRKASFPESQGYFDVLDGNYWISAEGNSDHNIVGALLQTADSVQTEEPVWTE
jgi:hypothetical protein